MGALGAAGFRNHPPPLQGLSGLPYKDGHRTPISERHPPLQGLERPPIGPGLPEVVPRHGPRALPNAAPQQASAFCGWRVHAQGKRAYSCCLRFNVSTFIRTARINQNHLQDKNSFDKRVTLCDNKSRGRFLRTRTNLYQSCPGISLFGQQPQTRILQGFSLKMQNLISIEASA